MQQASPIGIQAPRERKFLTLEEAKSSASRKRAIGLLLRAVGIVGVVVVGVSGLFHNEIIDSAHNYLPVRNELLTNLLHRYPTIAWTVFGLSSFDQHKPLTSWVNLVPIFQFALSFVAGFAGVSISESGRQLAERIKQSEQRAQDRVLDVGQGLHVGEPPKAVLVSVSTDDKWWTRPKGILALMILGGVVVAILIKLFHLGP